MIKLLMVQGTSSFAGKSFVTLALCRIFSDLGYRVAPFKAQNTSLNSYVTSKGEEIARAQALQALAARVEPRTEMNPILLKPTGERSSQIVVMGKPFEIIEAQHYYRDFALQEGEGIVKRAFEKLKKDFDVIIMEGAGSPAEINLYHRDIANMRAARLARAPVILVADIDRGGVFASIYGTVNLLASEDREKIKGIIINKFRGDIEILEPGIVQIEELTNKKVLGTMPFLENLHLPEEDSLGLEDIKGNADVAVIRLPRISNFTDFDALTLEGLMVKFVTEPEEIDSAKAVVIPGSKNTTSDLQWLREKGFEDKLMDISGKKPIMGICGGFQMMGRAIYDSSGIEGGGTVKGLGFFDMETSFESEKVLRRVQTRAEEGMSGRKIPVNGYEIHMGRSKIREKPLFRGSDLKDGACIPEKKLMGTYLHGIFDSQGFREIFLRLISEASYEDVIIKEVWEASIKRVAEEFKKNINMEEIFRITGF